MKYSPLATNFSLDHVIWLGGCEDMPILKQSTIGTVLQLVIMIRVFDKY